MSRRKNCKVDVDGSVCLQSILDSFNSPILEEHAWALCYQCVKYYSGCLSSKQRNYYVLKQMHDIYLKTDGNIHEKTSSCADQSRKLLTNEHEVTGNLGVIIYNALIKGTDNDEERLLSEDLEQLISDMIPEETSHYETDDEGIEKDSSECDEARFCTHITFVEIIERCENHIRNLTKAQVETHYKAVTRAMVAEALELSSFLEKVEKGTLDIPHSSVSELNFSDWARFWVQVMNELRTGVKLKKINHCKAPIEFELTPYEILMKDIRNCRYNLKKIMINGDIPTKVTKDAHAIILEFIRSRPPLKKASDRKLPPQPRYLTPREQLLNSIRKGRKLRPTPQPRKSMSISKVRDNVTEQAPISHETPKGRRLIKVDFSKFNDDDEDFTLDSPDPSELSEPGLWSTEYSQISDVTLEAYDLATEDVIKKSNFRRNTLGVLDHNVGCYSVPQSRPCSRQSCNSSETESIVMEPDTAKQLQEELTSSKAWEESISLDNRLSLTLSEIVHIRAVLTKAEVDALPTEGHIRQDVEARKVCFLCLKTRFGIFGPWGQRCTLCKRTVCSKCCSKMNIPMEHFTSVPVVLLSPRIMATPEEELNDSFQKTLVNKMTESDTVLKDKSPDTLLQASSMESSIISDPGSLSKFRTKAASVSRAARVVDHLRANQMMVCHDCKRMVLQIIKSARANRSAIRNKTLQNLTLDLSTVF